MFHQGFCNSSALQPHEDNLLHLPLPHFSHLWMGNSVISACSLVTERMCQWQEILIKTPWVLENKSSIQMSVRLLQGNMNIPITEETISWSILKKERSLIQGGKCTGEGGVILECRRQSQRLSVTLSSISGSSQENQLCTGGSSRTPRGWHPSPLRQELCSMNRVYSGPMNKH